MDAERESVGTWGSNFDHEIDADVCSALMERPGETEADYPGWDFFARVHVDPEAQEWVATVRRHCVVVDVVRAQSPRELMRAVCAKWSDA